MQCNKFAKLLWAKNVLLFTSEVRNPFVFPKWGWPVKVWIFWRSLDCISSVFGIHGVGSRGGEGRRDSCEVNILLPKKICGSPALLCFCPCAVGLCWSEERRHQSLLSSVNQSSLWFSVSRWELRKTHELQTAVEVLHISRNRGEDKRKTGKKSKGQCTQKGRKKRCVSLLFISVALPPGWHTRAL